MSTTLPDTRLPEFFPITGSVPGVANGLDVRVAAEFAADVRNVPLYFAYESATGAVTVSQTAPPLPWPLPPVATSLDAQRPTFDSLHIELASGQGLDIRGTEAGAVFWSEAAVEKFLVPYYASVYGWEAATLLLEAVSSAWLEYSGDRVQVVALAYAWGSPADFVTPTRTLEAQGSIKVIYAEVVSTSPLTYGPLKMDRLDAFLATPGYVGGAQGQPVGVANPAGDAGTIPFTGPGTLSSIDLRELAEFARGLKGQYLFFEPVGGAIEVNACPGMNPCPGPAGVFTCATGPWRPDRPAPVRVTATVTSQGATDTVTLLPGGPDLPAPADSIFWTDGALEKLMLPYYASVMGRQSPYFSTLLLGQWEGHTTPPILPLGEHDDDALAVATLGRMADGQGPAETDVFAVVHLPRSEYVPEPVGGDDGATGANSVAAGGQTLIDRTRLLRLDETGVHADRVVGRRG